ncbi:hypothetical protein BC834DRAFT_966631 [Gloeopeniophorella convolvens]|nr:hypothetical protein BC834DRAFT_966631 [Gloeopeniophorella convolvens]
MTNADLSPSKFSFALPVHPFDDPRADLILRTSDGANFRVHQIILSLASTVFADKIDALPKNEDHDPPTIELQEDSKALNLALRQCYPLPCTEITELQDAHRILEFSRKYKIEKLRQVATRCLTDSIERHPVGTYAIAVAHGFDSIAVQAVKASLSVPFPRLQSPSLQHVTAEQYQLLIQYHAACGAAASAVASDRKWFPTLLGFIATAKGDLTCACTVQDFLSPPSSKPSDASGSPADRYYGPCYLWSYLHRAALVLASHPSVSAVTAEAFVLKDMDCSTCPRKTAKRDLLEFSQRFATAIQQAIEKIPCPDIRLTSKPPRVLPYPLFFDAVKSPFVFGKETASPKTATRPSTPVTKTGSK